MKKAAANIGHDLCLNPCLRLTSICMSGPHHTLILNLTSWETANCFHCEWTNEIDQGKVPFLYVHTACYFSLLFLVWQQSPQWMWSGGLLFSNHGKICTTWHLPFAAFEDAQHGSVSRVRDLLKEYHIHTWLHKPMWRYKAKHSTDSTLAPTRLPLSGLSPSGVVQARDHVSPSGPVFGQTCPGLPHLNLHSCLLSTPSNN